MSTRGWLQEWSLRFMAFPFELHTEHSVIWRMGATVTVHR